MYFVGNFLVAFAHFLRSLLGFYEIVVIASIVISWIRPNPHSPIVRQILSIIIRLTEPVFRWIRSKLPSALNNTGLDFSPIFLFLALYFFDTWIITSLLTLGYSLR